MSRYDLTKDDLAELLSDEPSYRVGQIWSGWYQRFAEITELTELSQALRNRLTGRPEFATGLHEITEVKSDNGATLKWLFALDGKDAIETVLMHYQRHSTVCVSSQAGCAMGCTFCATGQAGYRRHLSTGEILEQIVVAARAARSAGKRLDHVVFMGMGEPFANYDNVWRAVERIVHDFDLAARHVTLSTVGVIPGIRRLTEETLQVNLAVSLHAANDELRDKIVPINRRYRIGALLDACEAYVERTHRRLSFEWAMIDGVNDRESDALELVVHARRLGAHVNLIPLNPTSQSGELHLSGSSPGRIRSFRNTLRKAGVNVTVRQTRGREIDAACGQLAGVELQSTRRSLPQGAL